MDVAGLDHAIGAAHRTFLDSSACIAYQSTTEHVHPLARHLFERIAKDDDPLAGYVSVVSVSEMLIRPIRAGRHELELVSDFVREFPNLHVVNVTLDIAIQAAALRALSRLPLPDALLVATALLSECETIVTNDRAWSRKLGPMHPRFRWIYLGQ